MTGPTARREGPTDRALCTAAAEIETGLIDAWLSGSLLKDRVAKGNRGKSADVRTFAAYRQHDRLVFLYGFGNNERDNITEQEREALSEIGNEYMRLPRDKLNELVALSTLTELVMTTKRKASRILAEVHEAARDLCDAGSH
jgi:hypothetical protein